MQCLWSRSLVSMHPGKDPWDSGVAAEEQGKLSAFYGLDKDMADTG